VVSVTTLNDSGPGSFRDAMRKPFPRVIIFRVSGTIQLNSPINLSAAHSYVTVAGQTAPGDGILVTHAGLVIFGHDVVIRHIRVRPGNQTPIAADVNDAITILGADHKIDYPSTTGGYNIVLDHVSVSWAEDEVVSAIWGAHDITMSHSIVSEALHCSRHPKGCHGAGLLVAYTSDRISIHHNLFAHNSYRNPLLQHGGLHDVINNVIYNWGEAASAVTSGQKDIFANFVGNYYLAGVNTPPKTKSYGGHEIFLSREKRFKTLPHLYLKDNVGPNSPDPSIDQKHIVSGNDPALTEHRVRSWTPFRTPQMTSTHAQMALDTVLAGAGATVPRRDTVDARVVADVRANTGHIIDSPDQVGGFPVMRSGTPPVDTDRDGMPDPWEISNGLNPDNASDGPRVSASGYTNLENYLNELAGDTIPGDETALTLSATPATTTGGSTFSTADPIADTTEDGLY
jgi:pectate lyase